MQHSIICTLSLSHFKIQICQLSHLSNTLACKLPHTLHAIFIHTFFKATISHEYMDKMNGSSLGKQCQNSLPPPHLISTAYKDILWSSYLLVLNYMQATSAQAGQLSSQVLWDCTLHLLYNPKYKILKSEQFYECSYWNRQKTHQLSSLSHGHLIDASLISQCTWHRLTCLARWIGRGSRIMRSNAIGTFLLEDRNVIKDVPAWHPPSPLLHDPHHAIKQLLLWAAIAVHDCEIHH